MMTRNNFFLPSGVNIRFVFFICLLVLFSCSDVTQTTTVDSENKEQSSQSVNLIVDSTSAPLGVPDFEGSEDNDADPIDFYIPTKKQLNAGNGELPLEFQTLFTAKIDSDKDAILFLQEENTSLIGGPPAKRYIVVSTQTGNMTQVVPISYNPNVGEGQVLLTDMSEDKIEAFNQLHADEADKSLTSYHFEEVTKYQQQYDSFVEQDGDEWIVLIAHKDASEIRYEVARLEAIAGREIEILHVIEPLYDLFAIITYSVPGSMAFPDTLNGALVVGKSALSVLHKKIGFKCFEKLKSNKGIESLAINKCINSLNYALSLNGANAEAAFHLAATYALVDNVERSIEALRFLMLIDSIDASSYLEMAAIDEAFAGIRNDEIFVQLMNSLN